MKVEDGLEFQRENGAEVDRAMCALSILTGNMEFMQMLYKSSGNFKLFKEICPYM